MVKLKPLTTLMSHVHILSIENELPTEIFYTYILTLIPFD